MLFIRLAITPHPTPRPSQSGIPLSKISTITLLRNRIFGFILLFLTPTAMVTAFQEEIDPSAPQREAALFYGLFLRGHSAETLRRDIDVPKKLLDKLMRRYRNELDVREKIQRAFYYRKQVLAVFDELVTRERTRERVQ
jgi:hypothetical protein